MRKVYVSPTYHGNGWFDPKAGINFFKRDGVISIPDGVNTVNIDRYIKLNYLIEVKEESVEVIPQVVISTANELLSKVEEPKVEAAAPVVEVVEEPVKAEEPVVTAEVTAVSEEPKPEDVEKEKPKKAPKKKSANK